MPYLLVLLLLTGFCTKKTLSDQSSLFTVQEQTRNKTSIENNINTDNDITNTVYLSDKEFYQKIQEIIDFDLGDRILLDSPKRFLQISILFTLSQNSNYSAIIRKKNITDEDISTFMNKKRESFYKKLKITETEYINYGISNSADIQEFLATNTQFAEIYEIVQSQITE